MVLLLPCIICCLYCLVCFPCLNVLWMVSVFNKESGSQLLHLVTPLKLWWMMYSEGYKTGTAAWHCISYAGIPSSSTKAGSIGDRCYIFPNLNLKNLPELGLVVQRLSGWWEWRLPAACGVPCAVESQHVGKELTSSSIWTIKFTGIQEWLYAYYISLCMVTSEKWQQEFFIPICLYLSGSCFGIAFKFQRVRVRNNWSFMFKGHSIGLWFHVIQIRQEPLKLPSHNYGALGGALL